MPRRRRGIRRARPRRAITAPQRRQHGNDGGSRACADHEAERVPGRPLASRVPSVLAAAATPKLAIPTGTFAGRTSEKFTFKRARDTHAANNHCGASAKTYYHSRSA